MTELKDVLNLTFNKRRSLNAGYSRNAFARDLGVSPTALSQFLSGKRNLSKANIQRIIKSLDLPPEFHEQLSHEVIPFPDATTIKEDTFALIADWYHYAILNLTEIDNITGASQLSARLGISEEVANSAVARLLNLGFLRKSGEGYKRIQKSLDTGSDFPSEAMRQHHREKMELAIQDLEHGKMSERDISSLTVCFDMEKMPLLKTEIMRFKKRVAALCGPENASEVYGLNVQFFPLSHRTPRKR
jgi:uncharacterized protein (TIGR02147 family)